MVYNERVQLPRWLKHYERQIGSCDDLYVLDHGSTDGSTDSLKQVNIVAVHRDHIKGQTQTWRAKFVSDFCNNLLRFYEYVLYSDADELIYINDGAQKTINEFLSSSYASHAIGFDVLHDYKVEGPLTDLPILAQRSKLQLVAAMCKPCIIREPVRWAQGFHESSILSPAFGPLLLLHLRYADVSTGLQRLTETRRILRPDRGPGDLDHWKIDDETYMSWLDRFLSYQAHVSSCDMSDPIISAAVSNFEFRPSNGMLHFDYRYRSRNVFIPSFDVRQSVL